MEKDTICRITDNRLIAADRKSFVSKEKRHFCPKLNAAPDIVYSPDRLKRPLVKKKGKGSDHFVETSWDEALDLIADKFNWLKKEHGAESAAWLRGMAADWGAPWDYANRLMNLFGSPNTIGNGSVCHVAREMAHTFTYGAMTVPEIKKAKCIIIWGKNDMDTNPQAYENILYAKQHGAKLIVVDPVKIGLAEMADIWMQIKPGYDGMLAMSMIHEIISNKLYDIDFLNEWTVGFEPATRLYHRWKRSGHAA